MKFIVDTMLGKLAKWLRMLGFDTFYDPHANDEELLDRSKEEGGIILTRDTLFAERLARKGMQGNFLLLTHNALENQLQEVLNNLHVSISSDNFFNRCVTCNSPLQRISKSQVEMRVPAYVFATQDTFSTCPVCSRVYWGGTHKLKMAKAIDKIIRSYDEHSFSKG